MTDLGKNSNINLENCYRLRPVGRLERYSTARNFLGFYNNVAVTAYYRTDSSTFSQDNVLSALIGVIHSHPILSAIPIDEGSDNAYFVRLPEIDLRECLIFLSRTKPYQGESSDPEMDGLLTSQHNISFNIDSSLRPFWRLVILTHSSQTKTFAASFVYHHALGDGLSGKAFHRTLQKYLSDPFVAPLPRTFTPLDTPLLPELDKIHKLPVPLPRHIKAVYNDYFGNVSKDVWTGGVVSAPPVSNFCSSVVDPAVARRFLTVCRREDATVTSAISVIVSAALFSLIPQEYSELLCQVAISFRRWISQPVTEDSMGVYVASLQETFRRKDFSWDEARRARQTIAKFLATNGNDADVGLLRWVSDYKSHFCSKLGKSRSSSFEMSNLGCISNQDNTNWSIGRAIFSQSASVTGPAIEVCTVSGGDGSLTLGYAWQENVVERNLVLQLQKEVGDRILLLSK